MERPGRRMPAGQQYPTSRSGSQTGNWRHRLWGPVVGFGLVSLAADMVSDGARPLGGPLLAQLGASALFVGLVTGAAEAASQGLRLVFGPWADRTRKYWTFTMAGYVLTAVCVPLLALTPFAGTAGMALAAVLIIGDRVGKAVRSPAKTVLLAAVAGPVGRGRGFAVHKSLDLAGALLGPLLVSAVLVATGSLPAAFAVLIIPAAAALAILVWLRRRVRDPGADRPVADPSDLPEPPRGKPAGRQPSALSSVFTLFALAGFFWSAGLVAFGVISYHLTADVAVPVSVVPLLYAGAMGAAAVGALASGVLYDRAGAAVLLALPVLIMGVPVLALAPSAGLVRPGSWSGVPPPASRTPRSRRWLPIWCPNPGRARRTGCSRRSRAPEPWPAAPCTGHFTAHGRRSSLPWPDCRQRPLSCCSSRCTGPGTHHLAKGPQRG